jgi:beta-phosphoglucomutase-like phosphatase (HAD superfamily)
VQEDARDVREASRASTWLLADSRQALVGAAALALIAALARTIVQVPGWVLACVGIAILGLVSLFVRTRGQRIKLIVDVLAEPSSSASAFRLLALVVDSLRAGISNERILRDIQLVVSRRRYPTMLLTQEIVAELAAQPGSLQRRERVANIAQNMMHQRLAMRDRVTQMVAEYLESTIDRNTIIVLYGYSSTVCEGIAAFAGKSPITPRIVVLEDLQYGSDSVLEHELVIRFLAAQRIPATVIPLSELENLVTASRLHALSTDRVRVPLLPQRGLLAMIGCDAISAEGEALIPSVSTDMTSDTELLADLFLAGSHGDGRVPRKLVIVGESFKVAAASSLAAGDTSAPLRPSRFLQVLQAFGIEAWPNPRMVQLHRVRSGIAGFVTDEGICLPTAQGEMDLSMIRERWRGRVGIRRTPAPASTGNRRTVDGIVFDWNGVIAFDESLHFAAFARVCRNSTGHDFTAQEYLDLCSGRTDAEGIDSLISIGAAQGAMKDLLSEKTTAYRTLATEAAQLIPQSAIAFLRLMENLGVPFRVVTASPWEEVSALIDASELGNVVPRNLVIDDVASVDRYFKLMLAKESLRPGASILLVDDNERNIALGRMGGFVTARVGRRGDASEADYVISDLSELEESIEFVKPAAASQ